MKKEVHPNFFENAVITCSCGAVYEVGSTKETIKVEICSSCHPFYSGQAKLIDTAGRVDRFKARAQKAKNWKKDK